MWTRALEPVLVLASAVDHLRQLSLGLQRHFDNATQIPFSPDRDAFQN